MIIRVKCHGDSRVHGAQIPEKGRNYALCGMYWDTLVDDWRGSGEVSAELITCMECNWREKKRDR